jgi:hypothetical protein
VSEEHHVALADDRVVRAEEVAEEFVATKLGLLDVIASVLGGQDFHIEGLVGWASESPVKLDDSDEALAARMDRAYEIHLDMMRAVGRHFLSEAAVAATR